MAAAHSLPALRLSVRPSAARRQLAELLADKHWGGDAEGAVLAVHEALVNSDRHAGGARRATATLDGSTLVVEVSDGGPGFAIPPDGDEPDRTAERGRGLWLIKHLASGCEVRRGDDDVCLRFWFDP